MVHDHSAKHGVSQTVAFTLRSVGGVAAVNASFDVYCRFVYLVVSFASISFVSRFWHASFGPGERPLRQGPGEREKDPQALAPIHPEGSADHIDAEDGIKALENAAIEVTASMSSSIYSPIGMDTVAFKRV